MLNNDTTTQALNCLNCLSAIQDRIAGRVVLKDSVTDVTSIAAVGHAFSCDAVLSHVVVVDLDMQLIDESTVIERVQTPYVPGLLFCREGPAILKAVSRLRDKFDVLLVDACGINHYRFAGLASHIGVLLDVPTIGVSKRTLCGEYSIPREMGHYCEVRWQNRKVGFILKTREGTKPIFISPGHRVSLQSSLVIVQSSLRGHKLPEPLRLAHVKAQARKRAFWASN
ncbi:MAG: endonuclease V [Euryarchaeota archaeon]|nr:endonuclease V [Euryarchaeota archaeon]